MSSIIQQEERKIEESRKRIKDARAVEAIEVIGKALRSGDKGQLLKACYSYIAIARQPKKKTTASPV